MTTAGLSKTGLSRMREVMAGHVERGTVPGLITLLSRRGEVHVEVIGTKSIDAPGADGGDPVWRDTIFRISSMTKPITAAAAMILVQEGRLRLDEPVDRLLPELAGRRVLARLDGPLEDTVPAERPITVCDLLTFRMGLGIIMEPGSYPIQEAMAQLQLGQGPPSPSIMPAPDEWMRRLGRLPLMHQPGQRWMYSTGSDVLGVLIARASGQPLETFLAERLFDPLGMTDTGFSVPASKIDRLATGYLARPDSGRLVLFDAAEGGQWSRPPAFPSGAGGLVSTVDDYLAFAQMMLDKGTCGAERMLSRASVETMTTDHLTAAQKAVSGGYPGYWDGHGWGFGMSVTTRRGDLAAAPGGYGWDGGLGTSWYTDPQHELIAILMTQRCEFPMFSPVYLDFWKAVQQAIED